MTGRRRRVTRHHRPSTCNASVVALHSLKIALEQYQLHVLQAAGEAWDEIWLLNRRSPMIQLVRNGRFAKL
jgi:hypothetical protein